MPMDKSDYELVRNILRAVNAGNETLARQEKTDQELLKAFNRMATAMEEMTAELRALREDLTPKMDKPKNKPLKKPAAGGGR